MKVKILVNCPAGRWEAGVVGDVLVNDYAKYDYMVQLLGTIQFTLGGETVQAKRVYYFYADEVEVLP